VIEVPAAAAPPLRRHRDFMRLWAGETVSTFGSQVTELALPLAAVLTLSAGPLAMGVLTAAGTAPYLVVALPAGVWIDRLRRRRRLMILADLGRAALLASVPLAYALGVLGIAQLFAVALVAGALTVLFNTAFTTLLPGLVPEQHLAGANGRLQTSAAAAQVAGPGIAGALVQALSAPAAILIDAVSYLFSAAALSRIESEEAAPPAADRRAMRRDVAEGLRFVLGEPSLRAIVGSAATLNLFGLLIFSILILYARHDLHLEAGAIGLIFAAGGVGALIGALAAPWLARRLGQGRTIFAATVWFSVHLLVIPLATGSHAAVILGGNEFLGGVAVMVFDVNAMTLAQLATPAGMLGRMGATMGFVTQGAKPLGALLGGVLGELLGLHTALWVAGVGGTGAALWTWFSPLRSSR
jgi:MFS family permease